MGKRKRMMDNVKCEIEYHIWDIGYQMRNVLWEMKFDF